MTLEDFGRSLIILRKRQGLTQAELCYKAGISPSFYSRFENGLVPDISLRKLEAICQALGMSIWTHGKTPTGEEFALLALPKLGSHDREYTYHAASGQSQTLRPESSYPSERDTRRIEE